MRMRNLLLTFTIVLVVSAHALAQTPPPPSDPPQPPVIATPATPAEPMNFSFFFDGGNYLGIQPEEINRENMSRYGLSAPRGVGISQVSQGSPAERAGLKKNDVVLQLDGEPVTSTRKLLRLIGEAAPEQMVRLTISRNGSEQQVTATLGKREDTMRAYRALTPELPDLPRTPRTPQAQGYSPEVFSFGFSNNRRVGVTTTPLTKQLADFFGISGKQGLLITSVGEDSPASKAGLKAGDVVTEVNGEKVEDAADFVRALNRKDEGEVTLTIIRDKSQRTIKVTPERRQAPTFNLSELQPAAMAGLMNSRRYLMSLPKLRALQALPKIESFVMPKIDGSSLPRLMNLPRVELLPTIPRIL